MSDDVSDQPEEEVTDQTAEAGQGVEVVPTETATEETEEESEESEDTEPDLTGKQKRLEDKKAQKSQKEWSDMKAQVNEFTKFKATLSESLGIEEDEEEADVTVKMQQQIDALKEESNRKDWEVDHPIVRSEKYKEEWAKVNSDPKYSALDYDERWKIIKAETGSTTEKDIRDSSVGSVPPVSKAAPTSSDEIDPEVMGMLRKQFPRLDDEQIRKLSA